MGNSLPFIVFVRAFTVLVVLWRIVELFANVAIRIRFTAFVPLLQRLSSAGRFDDKTGISNLVTHETFCVFGRPRIPLLKIILLALSLSRSLKVEKHNNKASDIVRLILARDLTQEEELL